MTNEEIITRRMNQREKLDGPQVGDFVILDPTQEPTEYHRFSHDWGDVIQTARGGSIYLVEGGWGSFSGALDPSIPKTKLFKTGLKRPGRFWIFQNDYATAGNGYEFKVPVPVWVYDKTSCSSCSNSLLDGVYERKSGSICWVCADKEEETCNPSS